MIVEVMHRALNTHTMYASIAVHNNTTLSLQLPRRNAVYDPVKFWKGHEEGVESARKQYNFALFINSNELACFVLRFASCFTTAADSRALCPTNEGNYGKWVRRVLETIGTVQY